MKKKDVLTKLIVLIAFLHALIMTSCGSGAVDNPDNSDNQGVNKTNEKIVRIAASNVPIIDPGVGSDSASAGALINLYDTLIFPEHDGTLVPSLATDWQTSEDGLSWTFNIRKGVKFHNGDEVTAEDVAFSMERLLTMGEGFAYLFTDVVNEVKVIDEYTVQFNLKKQFGPFLSALVRFYVLNKEEVMSHIKEGSYGDLGDYGKDWLVSNDAGSGPYMVKERKAQEYVYAIKFNEYWNGWNENSPDAFKMIGATEAATIRTLMTRRELEISDLWQTNEALKTLSQINGIEISSIPGVANLNIMLNTKKPPTDDINFRKALSYIFDYEAAVKLFPGTSQAMGPVIAGTPGHNTNVFQYSKNLEKAKEYLSKSKYADNLQDYPIEILATSDVPDYEKIALLLQSNASEIGVKTEIVKLPWLSVIDILATPDTTPHASVMEVAGSYNEAGSMLDIRYHSRATGSWTQGEWLENAEIDAAIDDALETLDEKERFKKYGEIQEKLVDMAPTIFMIDKVDRCAYQSSYVFRPADQLVKEGKPHCTVMGYNFYLREYEIYPEKVPN